MEVRQFQFKESLSERGGFDMGIRRLTRESDAKVDALIDLLKTKNIINAAEADAAKVKGK